jgi:oxygen-independent coproporphyrinogen-3 oxidase
MIDAIARELILRKDYTGEPLETIYFGGGTPSFIDTAHIEKLMNVVRENFEITASPEITLEANPDDLTGEKSEALLRAGINRLSIGIQSFLDEDLTLMNRAHNAVQAIASVKNAQSAGFDNISIDLIYGTRSIHGPGQLNLWERNLDTALSLGVDHLSCYSLTVEKRTVLADMIRRKKIQPPDEDESIDEFERLIEVAGNAGFEHYEISNFARNKKYSRHNTSYWQRKKYLGVGPSAHSFDSRSRHWNVSNNQAYIKALSNNEIPAESEVLTIEDKFNEYILTSLRTMWGVDMHYIEENFGKKILEYLLKNLELYFLNGMLIKQNGIITLTLKGKSFADRIAGEAFLLKSDNEK